MKELIKQILNDEYGDFLVPVFVSINERTTVFRTPQVLTNHTTGETIIRFVYSPSPVTVKKMIEIVGTPPDDFRLEIDCRCATDWDVDAIFNGDRMRIEY